MASYSVPCRGFGAWRQPGRPSRCPVPRARQVLSAPRRPHSGRFVGSAAVRSTEPCPWGRAHRSRAHQGWTHSGRGAVVVHGRMPQCLVRGATLIGAALDEPFGAVLIGPIGAVLAGPCPLGPRSCGPRPLGPGLRSVLAASGVLLGRLPPAPSSWGRASLSRAHWGRAHGAVLMEPCSWSRAPGAALMEPGPWGRAHGAVLRELAHGDVPTGPRS